MIELSSIPDPSPRLERLMEEVMDAFDMEAPSVSADRRRLRPHPGLPLRPAEVETRGGLEVLCFVITGRG
jgi:hypothetical protein